MEIAHVTRTFAPSIGGMESVVRGLAREQIRAGHKVHVQTLRPLINGNEKVSGTETIDGIDVFRHRWFGSPRYPLAPSVLKAIDRYDVVHVHGVDFFFDAFAAARRTRSTLVATSHGLFFHTPRQRALKQIFLKTVTRRSARRYDSIIACSENDYRQLSELGARHVVMIENGVDLERFRSAGSARLTKSAIYFGRIAQNKRIDRLLAWFGALVAVDPEWRLTVASPGVPAEQFWRMNRGLEAAVRDRIRYEADRDDTELRGLMGDCSFFACASEYEGFGLVAVEAASAGLFPILSDIPTFRAIANAIPNCCVCDFSNPEAAASATVDFFRSVEASCGMSRGATMEATQQFGWPVIARRIEEVYLRPRG